MEVLRIRLLSGPMQWATRGGASLRQPPRRGQLRFFCARHVTRSECYSDAAASTKGRSEERWYGNVASRSRTIPRAADGAASGGGGASTRNEARIVTEGATAGGRGNVVAIGFQGRVRSSRRRRVAATAAS